MTKNINKERQEKKEKGFVGFALKPGSRKQIQVMYLKENDKIRLK